MLERPAALRKRKGQQAGRAAEAHGRAADDAPPVRPNFDGAPMLVGEIKKDVAVVLGDADVNRALGAVELRPRLEQVEGRIHAICARGIPRCLVILAPQPGAKAHAADRPSLAMPIDW